MKEPLDRNISEKLIKTPKHPVSQDTYKASNAYFHSDRIELVRNRFVYKSIYYRDVDELTVQKGFLLKNRWIIRLLSLGVLISMFLLFYNILTNSHYDTAIPVSPSTGSYGTGAFRSLAYMIMGPFALIILSILVLYQSTLHSTIIEIHYGEKTQDVRIRKLDKKLQTEELLQYLINHDNLVIDKRDVA